MKIRLLVLFSFLINVACAGEIPMANGTSPNGKLRLVMTGAEREESPGTLELRRNGSSIASLDILSYAVFPSVAAPENTTCLWAPDSKHFALMTRDSKRTWSIGIYAVNGSIRKLPTCDLTEFALETLHQDSTYRWSRETPMRWSDSTHIEIELSGDCEKSSAVKRYSGRVSVSIKDGRITLKEPFKIEAKEG